jgi:hypothetical protein
VVISRRPSVFTIIRNGVPLTDSDSAGVAGTVIKNTLMFNNTTVILHFHQPIVITGDLSKQHRASHSWWYG